MEGSEQVLGGWVVTDLGLYTVNGSTVKVQPALNCLGFPTLCCFSLLVCCHPAQPLKCSSYFSPWPLCRVGFP